MKSFQILMNALPCVYVGMYECLSVRMCVCVCGQGLTFMVVLGAFAAGALYFATRCEVIGAKFANGHINYQLEHFENFLLFFYFHFPFYY